MEFTRRIPGVSALTPAWHARVECCLSDDTRPILLYHDSAWSFCDTGLLRTRALHQGA